MISFTLKNKMLLLAVLPMLTVALAMMFSVDRQMRAMGDEEIIKFRTDMMQEKRSALEHHVAIAISAVAPFINTNPSDMHQLEAAKKVIRSMRFSDDGYMFVYDTSGTNIVHGSNSTLEGKNLIDLKDPSGKFLIRELIDAGAKGGGFVEYMWDEKTRGGLTPKLGYAVAMNDNRWILGSGFYIDDIDRRVTEKRIEIETLIRDTLLMIAGSAAVLLGLAIVLALFVARRVIKPLYNTSAALINIGHGEGDLTQRLQVD